MLICHCSCPDPGTAETLARHLVEERLAACVSVLPGIRSIYRWEGRIEDAAEVLLLVKTTRARFDALAARITELHPHDVPEVVAIDVAAGLPAYLDWVEAETVPATTAPQASGQ